MSKEDQEYIWYTKESKQFMENGYLLPGQSLSERVNAICEAFENHAKSKKKAEKLKDYVKRGWVSFSSPVWANYGTKRGLPISCFGSYIEDTMESILSTQAEIGMMSKLGGGTSAYFGNLRPRGAPIKDNGNSSGSVHFMKLFETLMLIVSQGSTRRGSMAAYLPVDHPDIMEFLEIKSEGFTIQDLSFGVTIPEGWMQSMIDGDEEKRKIWAKVLGTRFKNGYPYIFFADNANKDAPQVYKDKHYKITHSNLCSEIMLGDNEYESFVCCLSSVNLLHYDDWKDSDLVEIMIEFLDTVMQEFIDKSKNYAFMERATWFAENQRALGLGVLGWHSLLQQKGIAFESLEAKMLNNEIFKLIKEKADETTAVLAKELGEPELLKGYGRRNVTTLAVAPTKSSAFILGQVSEGIEPIKSNYYIQDLAKGKFTFKNPFLKQLLKKKKHDTDEVWEQILKDKGSVRNVSCLTQEEKDIFKTFEEIVPKEIIIQAAARQRYIDQGQSLNLMIHPKTPVKDVNALLIEAWKMGIKALYYQKNLNASRELLLNDIMTCKSCEA